MKRKILAERTLRLAEEFLLKPAAERVRIFSEHCLPRTFDVGDRVWCLHCEKSFLAENVAVDLSLTAGLLGLERKETIYFKCPNDGCDGSPLDFHDFPWWNPELEASRRRKQSKL